MPTRHDDMILRILRDMSDIRSALRRVVSNLPLYDIANENTPTQLSASQNNYVPGNYDVLRLSSSRAVSLTGLRNGVKGRAIRIFNVGEYSIFIPHLSNNSLSANRFKLQGGKDPVYLTSIEPSTNMEFYYDSTNQKWITLANPPAYDIGEDWEAQTAPVYTNDVCYSPELDLYVAVGASSACMTSSDGITWTQRTIGTGQWLGVAWVPEFSIFVAVAADALRIAYSYDGIAWFNKNGWTTRTAASSSQWQSVCWSPEINLFCAVANGTAAIMTSPDGVTWTSRTPPVGAGVLVSVCWSPDLNLFVAVSSSSTAAINVISSPDGITWTQRTGIAKQFSSVCWSPELTLFCAVGVSGAVMTSPDGITWTSRTASEANTWNEVCWSPELTLFCAVSSDGTNQVMTSSDGITWTARSEAEANQWQSVCWSPELGLFCAVAATGTNRVMTSPDGITWTARAASSSQAWQSICWSPEFGLFCAVCSNVDTMVSLDGINWTTYTIATGIWRGVCYASELELFCAVSQSTNYAATSNNMTTNLSASCGVPLSGYCDIFAMFSYGAVIT